MNQEMQKFGSNAVIKVIGVGGGGGNAINTMIESGLTGVEFIAANTDLQALQSNKATLKIQLGRELTKGLGAGANPDTGRDAALEDRAIIQDILAGADMVFITAGMGGGTGTGAAPIIAQVARELGALTVGVVTKPFTFEGKRRRKFADLGISSLRASVDTLITIPNQRLLSIASPDTSMLAGFQLADEVLVNAVKGISDIINIPGRVNVDFADVRTIMSEMGMALMGIGMATGAQRALHAAQSAINSPLLEEVDIEGATGILINITGSSSMTLHEISEASTLIQEAAHEDANIIFGAVVDESLGEQLRVTVIATGFDNARIEYSEPQTQSLGYPQRNSGLPGTSFDSNQSKNVTSNPTEHFTAQQNVTRNASYHQQPSFVPQSHGVAQRTSVQPTDSRGLGEPPYANRRAEPPLGNLPQFKSTRIDEFKPQALNDLAQLTLDLAQKPGAVARTAYPPQRQQRLTALPHEEYEKIESPAQFESPQEGLGDLENAIRLAQELTTSGTHSEPSADSRSYGTAAAPRHDPSAHPTAESDIDFETPAYLRKKEESSPGHNGQRFHDSQGRPVAPVPPQTT